MSRTQTYTVTGTQPFWGHQPGESFDVPTLAAPHERQLADAIAIGAVTLDDGGKPEPAAMTCPACAERLKRPPKLATPDELQEHYADRHAGLVVPDWTED